MSPISRLSILRVALAATALVGFGTPAAAEDEVSAFDLGGLDTRSAALMLSDQEAGDLAVSALAIPSPDPAGGGASRVTVMAEIGGASLLEAVPETASELITEVYAYAVDAEGALAGNLTRAFSLDLDRRRDHLARGGVKFFGGLDLPAGDYSLRVLVLQRSSGRLGLRILAVTVPSWGSEPVMLPPVRREPADGWLLVRAEGQPPAFPVTAGGRSWLPSAGTGLAAGERAGYLLLGRGLDRGLSAHLLAAGGEELSVLGLGDVRPTAGGPAGLEIMTAEIDAADLYAGEYRLRVAAAGSAATATLRVRPATAESTAVTAPQPTGISAREARGRDAEIERLEQLREAYRLTYDRLASGDRISALEPLIEVHRARVGTSSLAEQKRLAQAELQVAWELASPDPERLLAAIRVHETLYRHYHRERLFLLAGHSRKMIGAVSRLYSERSRNPEAPHLIACALVSLAGYLQQIGSLPAANEAYLQALDYDPLHPAALIGLAAIQESYGLYDRAVVLLQRLHKASPEDAQVRLRLGVNLRRQGKPKRAIPHLQAALSAPDADWVAVVAAQELASLHAEEGRVDDAIGVLEEASAARPDVQRLTVQLAALLDRAGRRPEAWEVLDRLDPTAGVDVSSPRLIYTRPPTAAITAARQVLADLTDRQLAVRKASQPTAPAVAGGGS